MRARLVGLGRWLPEEVRDNSAWPAEFVERTLARQGDRTLVEVARDQNEDRARAIVGRHLQAEENDPFLGALTRHVANDHVSASDAEYEAARVALHDAGVDGASLDAVLSWALVPDRWMPSPACEVAARLGATRAFASTLDAACASPVVQLEVAAGLIESGRARSVLLTQSHLASRVFSMEHPASPSVGDGATAMVVVADELGGIVSHLVTQGEHHRAVVWCRSKDPAQDTPWWREGGKMFMGSHDSAATRALIRDTVVFAEQTVRDLAARGGFAVEEIAALASVQPRRWVPEAIAEALAMDVTRAPNSYQRLAHLGGAGAVANLIEARDRGLLKPGSRAVLYAQGAGFTRGAVAVRW
jgi:3-oxoacyl-[acyl-carrier-protein] synthase III